MSKLADMKKQCLILLIFLLSGNCLLAQTKIRPEEAAKHAGETVTLTARVENIRFYFKSPDRPVVFSLVGEGAENTELLTLVVKNAEKDRYLSTGKQWHKRTITVTGTIALVNGKPQIEIKNPDQVRLTTGG
jgi:hypothetical protein